MSYKNRVRKNVSEGSNPSLSGVILAVREFEYNNQEIESSQSREALLKAYLESRLIDLFPEYTYTGFMDDAEMLSDNMMLALDYELNLDTISDEFSVPSTNSYRPFDSIVSDYHYSDLYVESPELEELITYLSGIDSLSQQSIENRVTRLELENFVTENSPYSVSGKMQSVTWLGMTKMFVAYKASRFVAGLLFKELIVGFVEDQIVVHFGTETQNDPCNAYKHTVTAMLFRTDFGIEFASLGMWLHELLRENNPCNEMQMDFHNNVLGYVHKYYFFRKPLTTFYWKRKKFSKRVADFVKDESANGVYVNGQDRVTAWEFRDGHYPHQDCEWCRSDRKNNLDEEKYIFIAY